MKVTSITAVVRLLWYAKKRWAAPARADVLIFDRNGSEVFAPYLLAEPAILDLRGESINLRVLLMAILHHGLRVTFGSYAQEYVRVVKPRLVLTHIDNTLHFYALKQHQPDLVTISVQNGMRDNVLFDTLAQARATESYSFRADHILCFGTRVGDKYAEQIEARIEPVGSFMNNSVPRSRVGMKTNLVMFLSQFRVPHADWKEPVMPVGEKMIDWGLFYEAERFLLPGLKDYCQRRGLMLTVCGCSLEERDLEQAFFEELLGESGWEFLPRVAITTSYERLDTAGCVAFIDSTLGYEALARGVRTAVFSWRGKATGSEDRGFGLTVRHPPTGPFWTTRPEMSEIDRVMEYICSTDAAEWDRVRNQYASGIMEFDPGNQRFVELLRHYNIAVREAPQPF